MPDNHEAFLDIKVGLQVKNVENAANSALLATGFFEAKRPSPALPHLIAKGRNAFFYHLAGSSSMYADYERTLRAISDNASQERKKLHTTLSDPNLSIPKNLHFGLKLEKAIIAHARSSLIAIKRN